MTLPNMSAVSVTDEEKRLLEIMAEIKFGDIVVRIRDGKPFMVDKITEKIALSDRRA